MKRRDVVTGLLGAFVGAGAVRSSASFADVAHDVSAAHLALERLAQLRHATSFIQDKKIESGIVKKVVDFGVSALSHRNSQPWFISVVSDETLLKEIDAKSELDSSKRLSFGGAPVAVIVSATQDDSDFQHYAIGCLIERMTLAACSLGLGCKTVMAGLKGSCEEPLRGRLHIPEGYDAYVALLLGYEETPTVDGVSGATSREVDSSKIAYI